MLNAAEVDQFSTYDQNIKDSKEIINQQANHYLQEAVQITNNVVNCSQTKNANLELYVELREFFANHLSGKLLKFILESDSVDKVYTDMKTSIYRGWPLTGGALMFAYRYLKRGHVISPEIRVGDVRIGTDKFEHMFGQGFKYFNSHYLKGRSLPATLISGAKRERIILGGNVVATGVFSYGDLSANFNGMRFWNHILGHGEDVLGQNIGPYIICENGKFKVNQEIDFSVYIDHSMNETTNCSYYPAKSSRRVVSSNLDQLGLSCPAKPDQLAGIVEKYSIVIEGEIESTDIGPLSLSSGKRLSDYILNLADKE
jgi:hypothetical protein